jgi:hypothetical protein
MRLSDSELCHQKLSEEYFIIRYIGEGGKDEALRYVSLKRPRNPLQSASYAIWYLRINEIVIRISVRIA